MWCRHYCADKSLHQKNNVISISIIIIIIIIIFFIIIIYQSKLKSNKTEQRFEQNRKL